MYIFMAIEVMHEKYLILLNIKKINFLFENNKYGVIILLVFYIVIIKYWYSCLTFMFFNIINVIK